MFFVVVTLFGMAMTVGIVMVDDMIEIVMCSSNVVLSSQKKCTFEPSEWIFLLSRWRDMLM